MATITIDMSPSRSDWDCIVEMAGYGINYWAGSATEIGEETPDGSHVKQYDVYPFPEHKDGQIKNVHRLTLEDLDRGLGLFIKEQGTDWYGQSLLDDDGVFDAGAIDSLAADLIVQYAAFGELIFG